MLTTDKYEELKTVFRLDERQLLSAVHRILLSFYDEDKVHDSAHYQYAEGGIPVLLVAHLDTVHPNPPALFVHDPECEIIWSPQGLGADDRAGVFSIIQTLIAGYRPYILFTTQEEPGGIGAEAFIQDFPKPPDDLQFILELDRKGEKEAVYYGCGNEDFENFITRFGFATDLGTFSDISIIAPAWDVAAVNLSIGYFCEHTRHEFLCYGFMFDTINKVEHILDNLDGKKFDFQPIEFYLPRFDDDSFMCDSCNAVTPKEDVITCMDEYESDTWRLCPSCYELNKDIVRRI